MCTAQGEPFVAMELSSQRGYQHCWYVREWDSDGNGVRDTEELLNALSCDIVATPELQRILAKPKGSVSVKLTMKRDRTSDEADVLRKKGLVEEAPRSCRSRSHMLK